MHAPFFYPLLSRGKLAYYIIKSVGNKEGIDEMPFRSEIIQDLYVIFIIYLFLVLLWLTILYKLNQERGERVFDRKRGMLSCICVASDNNVVSTQPKPNQVPNLLFICFFLFVFFNSIQK